MKFKEKERKKKDPRICNPGVKIISESQESSILESSEHSLLFFIAHTLLRDDEAHQAKVIVTYFP